MTVPPYKHTRDVHNLQSPKEIMRHLTGMLKVTSAVDIGCGTGTFLKALKDNNASSVLGIDGHWVDRGLLSENLASNEFLEKDLMTLTRQDIPGHYDLAICLEVAEHLPESRADQLVDILTSVSDAVLFSAAVPYQGGQNHINEQWQSYWLGKFRKQGFVPIDRLRALTWDNSLVFYWYRQNMFLLMRETRISSIDGMKGDIAPVDSIHPELFLKKARRLDQILKGQDSLGFYAKLLIKGVVDKLKL